MNNKYKRKKTVYTQVKFWNLYIILFSENKFYIGMTTHNNLKTVFRQHYHMKYLLTKEHMEKDINKNYLPEIFYLESFEDTKSMTFSRLIAWAKMLMKNNYECVNGDVFVSYTNDLEPHTEEFYNEIKDMDLDDLLSTENSLYSNFKSKKQTTKKAKICIELKPEDYALIEKKAAEAGLSKSAYCRQMALKGSIIHFQSPVSGEYLKELRDGISTIQQAIVTIHRLGQYFPKDLEKIENYKNIVENHYVKMLEESSKINNKIYRKRN